MLSRLSVTRRRKHPPWGWLLTQPCVWAHLASFINYRDIMRMSWLCRALRLHIGSPRMEENFMLDLMVKTAAFYREPLAVGDNPYPLPVTWLQAHVLLDIEACTSDHDCLPEIISLRSVSYKRLPDPPGFFELCRKVTNLNYPFQKYAKGQDVNPEDWVHNWLLHMCFQSIPWSFTRPQRPSRFDRAKLTRLLQCFIRDRCKTRNKCCRWVAMGLYEETNLQGAYTCGFVKRGILQPRLSLGDAHADIVIRQGRELLRRLCKRCLHIVTVSDFYRAQRFLSQLAGFLSYEELRFSQTLSEDTFKDFHKLAPEAERQLGRPLCESILHKVWYWKAAETIQWSPCYWMDAAFTNNKSQQIHLRGLMGDSYDGLIHWIQTSGLALVVSERFSGRRFITIVRPLDEVVSEYLTVLHKAKR
eukprot:Blabericola_migrator_1__5305@NODE_2722_length_2423_cov_344_636672_g1704_i0_p1_GENE_NODE_2722_length_2423_cov_344_636672_g1704_i0NODE_2722_length_2423_cov_344_636672_g1704_i0_p1_ORF_typecomplete_len416_score53_85_NODE_2722_length_2423_cov_344_636672_g1704_i01501397